jgi:phosphoenolpyruvate carboxykinase (ATP)
MTERRSRYGLEHHGLQPTGKVYWNLAPALLIEHAVQRGEGHLAAEGPFNAITTPHTGRSPNDKFIVRDETTEQTVAWGKVNQSIAPEKFDGLLAKVQAYLSARDLFVRDVYTGADPEYRVRVRVVTERAWANLFAFDLFIRPEPSELEDFVPDWVVLHAPSLQADPAVDGTRTGTFVVVNFARRLIVIGGTGYAGEIKKSIFSILNYVLPLRGVLSMHCSANVGKDGQSALFFGLSGTGKTSLSADPERGLIGDDEHGWSDNGVFNFEGGCYAKVIKLSPTAEPQIWATTRRFGTVLENVVLDPVTQSLNLDDDSITENTRAAYPIYFIDNAVIPGVGPHPKNVLFLTADAFGVMPPLSKLTLAQARYYFLSGYTAKVAGTERGITEPEATFSTCFGAPFLPLRPDVYSEMLGERLVKHDAQVWLVNTGWSGGPYGVGSRIKIAYTRAMVRAILTGALNDVEFTPDPFFHVLVPRHVHDVPDAVLQPRGTWADGAAYDAQARDLACRFIDNFKKFEAHVSEEVRAAGPTSC